jgi:hypothetical protein
MTRRLIRLTKREVWSRGLYRVRRKSDSASINGSAVNRRSVSFVLDALATGARR